MKIYVAGNDIERAQTVMGRLRESGHEITYDWTLDISEKDNLAGKAYDEREAVRNADALVYLWSSDQESARFEAGMAMGLGKPVVVSGKKEAFFFLLPEVIPVGSDEEIYDTVNNL